MSEHMVKRIYTFGYGQPQFPGYVVVYGRDDTETRAAMNRAYNRIWSMEYRTEEEAGVERWNLPLRATIVVKPYIPEDEPERFDETEPIEKW